MKIYKDTNIRSVLKDKDYKKIVPDAKNIEHAINRYTNDCYKKQITKYNKFYYIFNIELLPIKDLFFFKLSPFFNFVFFRLI